MRKESVMAVQEALQHIRAAERLLSQGPMSYYVSTLVECYQELLRYSRFQEGQTVELRETPVIDETHAHGWLGAKHCLVEGARGVVREVSHTGREFRYLVAMSGMTWVDQKGDEHPLEGDQLYTFREEDLIEKEGGSVPG